MSDPIEAPALAPPLDKKVVEPDQGLADPRHIEKALLGSAGVLSIVWLGLIGWLIWLLVS